MYFMKNVYANGWDIILFVHWIEGIYSWIDKKMRSNDKSITFLVWILEKLRRLNIIGKIA